MRNIFLVTLCSLVVLCGCEDSDSGGGSGQQAPIQYTSIGPSTPAQNPSVPGDMPNVDDILANLPDYSEYEGGEIPASSPAPAASEGSEPQGLPVLSIDSPSVYEGDDGTTRMMFIVRLSRVVSSGVVTVNFGLSGTASSGSDYSPPAAGNSVWFTSGQGARTIDCYVNGDTIPEGNETIVVDLYSPGGATIGTSRGVGTIIDDD